jgi:hypothetical protein
MPGFARRRRLLLLLACLLLVSLTGCNLLSGLFGPPPGQGPKAEQGYAASAPVIAALAAYYADRQTYPAALEELTPGYLSTVPKPEQTPLRYTRSEQSYQLEFKYAGPGMNICTYTPEEGWHCIGYY